MKIRRTRILLPEWPAPSNVKAYSTLRYGPDASGFSKMPYDRFNLAMHVGDEEDAVRRNRGMLREELELPSEPFWLEQTHSSKVVVAADTKSNDSTDNKADASYTMQKNTICVVLTADCLPVLLCDKKGTSVAAVHAGWRGLLDGVLANTITAMQRPGSELLAWLGPAIGPDVFEVGDDVRDRFVEKNQNNAKAFIERPGGKWLANIYQLAAIQLFEASVDSITGGQWCTYLNQENFFSYRRNHETGRMASLVWIQ